MHLVAIGDCLVDRYSSDEQMFAGGSALNVAVFAAYAGAQSTFIGAVGSDKAGRVILDDARAEGVNMSLVLVRPGSSAHANVGLVDGDRIFLGSGKGVSVFEPTEAHLEAIGASDVVHTGHSSTMENHLRAFSQLAPVSFDFSWHQEPAYLDRVLPYVSFAHFSGGSLGYAGRELLVRRAFEHNVHSVLVTRGAEGAEYYENGQRWFQKPHATTVVDTLGAGDTMIATLLARHLGGDPPEVSLNAAAAAAARTCARLGAFGVGAPFHPHTATRTIKAMEPG
jgi:fructoselysine 6-kinase